MQTELQQGEPPAYLVQPSVDKNDCRVPTCRHRFDLQSGRVERACSTRGRASLRNWGRGDREKGRPPRQ